MRSRELSGSDAPPQRPVFRLTTSARNGIAAGLVLLGTIFLCVGILRGEMETVLMKAINICLECVGIG